MNFEMPDIEKIRKEIDEKNAEIEKKGREEIEEEYERLSKQEKPAEEPKKEEPKEQKERKENGKEGPKEQEEEKEEPEKKKKEGPKEKKGEKEKEPSTAKAMEGKEEEPKEEKGEKEKEKEDLEKEITKNFYDELKKIKDTPGLKMEKTEKYFQLIENWQDLACLDNYKGIKSIFSELDKLKPSIWFYNLKKARITNNVAKSMASNYEEWDLEDKEKLKIIKNFVNKQSKEKNFLSSFFYSRDKTLKEIAQILALEDIPFKGNIEVIVKEIENPDIKSKTIESMADIEKQSIEKKKQSLQNLKEDMKHDKLPPDKIIIELFKKLGVDSKAASEILPKLVNTLENPEVQKEFEELSKTKEFQKFKDTIEKVTKGEEGKEIPEAVKKVKEHIKDEKESPWKTAFGVAGWSILLFLVLFMLAELKGVDLLTGVAGGKKKKIG